MLNSVFRHHRRVLAAAALAGLCCPAALGQHAFENTYTVDPSGAADYTTISAALLVAQSSTVQQTILVYAGVYPESISLGLHRENIDIVGIDRDAVIIEPPEGNGVTISAFNTADRRNALRNLTVRTHRGHGVEIVGNGQIRPFNVTLDNIVVTSSGAGNEAVRVTNADLIEVRTCELNSEDANSMHLNDCTKVMVQTTTLACRRSWCVHAHGNSSDVSILNCSIASEWIGVRLLSGERIRLQDCVIAVDNSTAANPHTETVGLFFDRMTGAGPSEAASRTAMGCSIAVRNAHPQATETIGVQTDADDGPVVEMCEIQTIGATGNVYGVYAGEGSGIEPDVTVRGGSISASSDDDRATEVYDLKRTAGALPGLLRVSGVRCTSWFGPVTPAVLPSPVVESVLAPQPGTSTAILGWTQLTAAEQEIASGLSNPDVLRTVSVTGNTPFASGSVLVIGTDRGGDPIAEAILLSGNRTVAGNRPFRTVTKVVLPASAGGTSQVAIGVSTRLGLLAPLSGMSHVLQQEERVAASTQYTVTPLGGVSETWSWVDVGPIASPTDYRWSVASSN